MSALSPNCDASWRQVTGAQSREVAATRQETLLRPLRLGSCGFPAANCFFWLQLQTHGMKGSLSGNIYNSVIGKGVSRGTFHTVAEVNLHLVSCGQRLPPDVPCLLRGQPALGAQHARAQPGKGRAHPHLSWLTVGIYMKHLLKPHGKETGWGLACPPNDTGTVPTHSLLLLTLAPTKKRRVSMGLVLCGAKRQSRTDFISHHQDFLIFTTLGQW